MYENFARSQVIYKKNPGKLHFFVTEWCIGGDRR